jgi:hypothetical protein
MRLFFVFYIDIEVLVRAPATGVEFARPPLSRFQTDPSDEAIGAATDFLRSTGDKSYRTFVEYHLRRQSTERLKEAGLGETLLLPDEYRQHIEVFIDAINGRLGYDKEFWRVATCRQAFDLIMDTAIQIFPILDDMPSRKALLKSENQEILYGLFQIATANFAYSASYQRGMRKFMGIRKGILR